MLKAQPRRGRELETRIERGFDQINALPGVIAVRIEIRQVRLADRIIFAHRQPCDCVVRTRKGVFWFDLKETRERKWYPSHAPAHQLAALQTAQALGDRAAWVIWFRSADTARSLRWVENLETPATVDSGIVFDWEMFL